MKSLITQFYYEYLESCSDRCQGTEEQQAELKRYKRKQNDFVLHLNTLEPGLAREFELLLDNRSGVYEYELTEAFRSAFQMGGQLMLELMMENWPKEA